MSLPSSPDGTIEQCVDEIGEFMTTLTHYSEPVLAYSLRMHLEGLLSSLLEQDLCTIKQAREFLAELAQDVLEER